MLHRSQRLENLYLLWDHKIVWSLVSKLSVEYQKKSCDRYQPLENFSSKLVWVLNDLVQTFTFYSDDPTFYEDLVLEEIYEFFGLIIYLATSILSLFLIVFLIAVCANSSISFYLDCAPKEQIVKKSNLPIYQSIVLEKKYF